MKKILKNGLIALVVLIVIFMIIGMFSSDEETSSGKDNEVQTENTSSKKKEEKSESIVFPLEVVNNTGVDIYKLYSSQAQTDDWEEDVLGEGILYDGESITINFKLFDESSLVWDFRIEDSDGNYINFYNIDFSGCDTNGGKLVLKYDGNEGTATLY